MSTPTKPDTANLSRAEYDQEDALSFTGLKELLKSPAHYQHFRTAVREETKALIIGSATHSAVLTPDLFKDAYAMAPECDRRTSEGKAVWKAAQDALKPGQKVLSFDDYKQVMDIADAVTKIWNAGPDAWNEAPLFGTTEHGTPIKGIPDCISADGWIWDLKTTSDGIDERSALRTILNYKYHVQAAHYIRLAQCHRGDINGHRIIMVEKDTLQVAMYEIAGEVLQAGRDECQRAYALFDNCRTEAYWPTILERQGILRLDTLPGSKAKAGATISF